jgi:peptidoglycan/LPS O-acetylase OafA/YrhL
VSTINYRPDIDGLRAIAVLGVVLYHLSPITLPGGFLGVDIFFVISGYLISRIVFREMAEGVFSFSAFYARRIRRLFPALAVVLAATIGFGAFSLFANEYERLAKHVSSTILFLLNFRLMGEAGYFDISSDTKPLLHLWSLSVEEQFYLIWPVLLVVSHKIRFHAGWMSVVLIVASFAFALHFSTRNLDALYFHPLARFWELLIGATLAWAHHQGHSSRVVGYLSYGFCRDVCSIVGILIIAGAFLFWNETTIHPGGLTILPVLGATMLIASGSAAIVNRLLALKPLVWIGLISYPLYLWHWPILSYIRITEFGSPSNMDALDWRGAFNTACCNDLLFY